MHYGAMREMRGKKDGGLGGCDYGQHLKHQCHLIIIAANNVTTDVANIATLLLLFHVLSTSCYISIANFCLLDA